MNRPYSEATVELAVKAIVEANWTAKTPGNLTAEARAVLDALFKAGLLLPEGAETRTEWGARLTWDDGTVEDLASPSEAFARRRVAMHAERRANRPGWRATADLIRREVTTVTGAWTSVDAVRLEGDSKAFQDPSVSVEETPQ